MLFFNRRVILEEEVPVVCTRSPQHDVVNKWSHDQKIKAEVRQAESLIRSASRQGDSYWSGDDKLSDSFEMMHTSPDLFSQPLSVIRSDTPYLSSSPTLLKGECYSWCSKQLSATRDLFSSPNYSPSRQK